MAPDVCAIFVVIIVYAFGWRAESQQVSYCVSDVSQTKVTVNISCDNPGELIEITGVTLYASACFQTIICTQQLVGTDTRWLVTACNGKNRCLASLDIAPMSCGYLGNMVNIFYNCQQGIFFDMCTRSSTDITAYPAIYISSPMYPDALRVVNTQCSCVLTSSSTYTYDVTASYLELEGIDCNANLTVLVDGNSLYNGLLCPGVPATVVQEYRIGDPNMPAASNVSVTFNMFDELAYGVNGLFLMLLKPQNYDNSPLRIQCGATSIQTLPTLPPTPTQPPLPSTPPPLPPTPPPLPSTPPPAVPGGSDTIEWPETTSSSDANNTINYASNPLTSNPNTLSKGAIAGIVIGSIAAALVIGAAVLIAYFVVLPYYRRKEVKELGTGTASHLNTGYDHGTWKMSDRIGDLSSNLNYASYGTKPVDNDTIRATQVGVELKTLGTQRFGTSSRV